MQPTDLTNLSDDVVLHHVSALLTGGQLDLAAARQLFDRIDPQRSNLKKLAGELIQVYAAKPMATNQTGSLTQQLSTMFASWAAAAKTGDWRALGIPAVLVLGVLAYAFWPSSGGLVGEFAPVAAAPVFPPQRNELGRTQPYFQSRYSAIHIPGPLGDAKGWNLAGQFHAACEGTLGQSYYLDGAMMADQEYFHIRATVGDFFPMRCSVPPCPLLGGSTARSADVWATQLTAALLAPETWGPFAAAAALSATEPEVWRGGGLQIHLALDRFNSFTDLPERSGQEDSKFVKLTLWFDQPSERGYVMISRKMKPTPRRLGEFVIHASGASPGAPEVSFQPLKGGHLGYEVTSKIPWKLLTDSATWPPAGEVPSLVCWEVHWSENDGATFRGKLIEVVNPANQLFPYEDARAWGRAIYHFSK